MLVSRIYGQTLLSLLLILVVEDLEDVTVVLGKAVDQQVRFSILSFCKELNYKIFNLDCSDLY